MDASFTPKQPAPAKKYKHFTIPSYTEKKTAVEGQVEFFYIGKNSLKINFLIDAFGSGYAVEQIQKAQTILSRLGQTNNIPHVFIFDHSMGQTALGDFIQFTGSSKILSMVPFILEASGLNKKELEEYRSLQAVDDIIFLDDANADDLMRMVTLLGKVKKNTSINQVEHSQRMIYSYLEWKNLFKRTFDIIISLFLIIVLSPVFLLIALVIKLESKGPVLYVSKRAGRGYHIFSFYKFRTMVIDADKNMHQLFHSNHYYNEHDENGSVFFKVVNDTRITRVGAFLRHSSMDELPQFFNVLLGNMSFVGNRPLPLYEAARLTTDEWADRFMAPAGITGLWQVKKRKQEYMTMEERINLDIAYSKNYNFMYDLWIMANTPSALIQKSNT